MISARTFKQMKNKALGIFLAFVAICYLPVNAQARCFSRPTGPSKIERCSDAGVKVSITTDKSLLPCGNRTKDNVPTQLPCYNPGGKLGKNQIVCLTFDNATKKFIDPETGEPFVPIVERVSPPHPVEYCRIKKDEGNNILSFFDPPSISVKGQPPHIRNLLCPEKCKNKPPAAGDVRFHLVNGSFIDVPSTAILRQEDVLKLKETMDGLIKAGDNSGRNLKSEAVCSLYDVSPPLPKASDRPQIPNPNQGPFATYPTAMQDPMQFNQACPGNEAYYGQQSQNFPPNFANYGQQGQNCPPNFANYGPVQSSGMGQNVYYGA